jgi:hypothetical protein
LDKPWVRPYTANYKSDSRRIFVICSSLIGFHFTQFGTVSCQGNITAGEYYSRIAERESRNRACAIGGAYFFFDIEIFLKNKSALNLGAADGPPKASIIVFYRGRFAELAGAHAMTDTGSKTFECALIRLNLRIYRLSGGL